MRLIELLPLAGFLVVLVWFGLIATTWLTGLRFAFGL
jgi:hypothetical protein